MDENDKAKSQDTGPADHEKADLKENAGGNSEIIKTGKIIDTNVNDEGMEVHVKQHKEGKKLRFYIYEFFMLFIAVTSGFFVENIRERNVEHHREGQYIKSLISDVKLDTLMMNRIISQNLTQQGAIDTLLTKLENPDSKKAVNYLYYYSFKALSSAYTFNHCDRTISQLKNSGGLRLIRNVTASNSIIDYYNAIHYVEANGDINIKMWMDLTKQERELLDFKVLRTKSLIDMFFDSQKLNNLLTDPNLKLLPGDSKRIDLYYNETIYYRTLIEGYRNHLIGLKTQATQLLETLNKAYEPV